MNADKYLTLVHWLIFEGLVLGRGSGVCRDIYIRLYDFWLNSLSRYRFEDTQTLTTILQFSRHLTTTHEMRLTVSPSRRKLAVSHYTHSSCVSCIHILICLCGHTVDWIVSIHPFIRSVIEFENPFSSILDISVIYTSLHVEIDWKANLCSSISFLLAEYEDGGVSSTPAVIQIALGQGLTLAVLVGALGNISGGHMNPAVTLGFVIARRISALRGLLYVLAQISGAILGAGLLYACVLGINYVRTHPYMV